MSSKEDTRQTEQGAGSKNEAARRVFGFRPWVRRAGFSILLVAFGITVLLGLVLMGSTGARYGWAGEPVVWTYVAVVWIGGLRIWLGTFRPIVELDGERIVIRPLHHLRARRVEWDRVLGTEQMIRGDRLIVYYDGARGLRHVALNLNLVRKRRELEQFIEAELLSRGFTERIVERSRYLSKRALSPRAPV